MTQPMPNDSTGGAPQGKADGNDNRSRLGVIASGVGVALLLAFVLQNSNKVEVHVLFWTFTWPLWLVIIIAAALGALVWFGAGVLRRHRRRANRREKRHEDRRN